MSRPDGHHRRRAPLGLWALVLLAVGLLAGLACAALAYFRPQFFFPSYLVAWLFFLGIALGSLAVSMLHHLTGGDWGKGIRRLVESAAATLILLALLFLPLVLGLEELYLWARSDAVQDDAVLASKARYLNVDFFCLRAGIYFLIWIVIAFFLNRWSVDGRRERAAGRDRRLQMLSGPGLALYGLSMTFAAIDWGMSLDPHWFSSMYGGGWRPRGRRAADAGDRRDWRGSNDNRARRGGRQGSGPAPRRSRPRGSCPVRRAWDR